MPVGKKMFDPEAEPIESELENDPGLDWWVGMMEACFLPDGTFPDREWPYLEGLLAAAQEEGFDPKKIYDYALNQVGNAKNPPPYEKVAPSQPSQNVT